MPRLFRRPRPIVALLFWLVPGAAAAADASALCRAAIAGAEAGTHIPDAFLSAIGRVESGRAGPGGAVAPWPWTVNALGQGHFYASRQEAVAAVRQWQQSGVRSIDVGCLQVNLAQHPEAFASLDEAFDPASNAAFAAKLLQALYQQTGSWPRAAAAYHSQTPGIGADYQRRVLAEWAIPDRPGADAMTAPPAAMAVPSQAGSPFAAGGGFSRLLRLPGDAPGVGRDLASYRRLPVRIAAVFRPR